MRASGELGRGVELRQRPGYPEAGRGNAQHLRPGAPLAGPDRPAPRVGGEQGRGPGGVEAAVGPPRPVVQGDGQIQQQPVDAGAVEVDHRAQPFTLEQRIVAEQVGVNDSPG